MADVAFNTSHIYEIPILKRHAEPLLKSIKADEPEFEMAQKLLTFLSEFDAYEDDSVVPNDSIIREFIGGSTYAEEDPETGKKTFVGHSYFLRNLQNFLREKTEEYKEMREEKREELKEIHEELIDGLEEDAKEDIEAAMRGESDKTVK